MAADNQISNKVRQIIFCNCRGERISSDLLSALDGHLRNMPVLVTKVSDLCGNIKKDKETITALFSTDAEHLVIGCYSRTMSLLLEQVNVKVSGISFLSLIETETDQALEQVEEFCSELIF